MRVGPDTVVTVRYSLKTENGDVVDTTDGLGRLSLLFEQTSAIPGLKGAAEGLAEGDTFSAKLAPDEAFGRRTAPMIQTLPRDRFPEDSDVYVGALMVVQTGEPAGYATMLVVSMDGDHVTVDLHHPLSGIPMTLSGEILGVRAVTEEERAAGISPHLDPED